MSRASSRPPHLIEACDAIANDAPWELHTKGWHPIGPNSPKQFALALFTGMAALPLFHGHVARFLAGPRLEAILWLREEEKRDLFFTKEQRTDLCQRLRLFRFLGRFSLVA